MLRLSDVITCDTWLERFPDKKVKVQELVRTPYWDMVFNKNLTKSRPFKDLVKEVNEALTERLQKKEIMYPNPDLLFRSLDKDPEQTSVLIIGQDPYHSVFSMDSKKSIKKCTREKWLSIKDSKKNSDSTIPIATGMSFSVPVEVPIPSSLQSIFRNGMKHKHFSQMPTHGDLSLWSYQGCTLLNTAFTVKAGQAASHLSIWRDFSCALLEHISSQMPPGVVVLWGDKALKHHAKLDLDLSSILQKKELANFQKGRHIPVISSHPSGLSAYRPFNGKFGNIKVKLPSFAEINQLGTINNILKEQNQLPIVWNLISHCS
jgi:uracil-DNA glycosylase